VKPLHHSPGTLVVIGGLTLLLGLLCIAVPFVPGLVLTTMLGLLLALVGGVGLLDALRGRSYGRGVGGALWALLSFVAGLILLFDPRGGLVALTLLLALYLLLAGLLRVALAIDYKPRRGWGWVLASGLLSLLLSFLIWRELPSSAEWVIGVLVGVHLVSEGLLMVALGGALKRAEAA
jgi:uncharacterized membrane protein HdeD (DUF308 family)